MNNIGYSYNDISIIPAEISKVNSRSEIELESLPIFTAPMSTIVDIDCLQTYIDNKITPIIPRNIDINIRKKYLTQYWTALSLKEARKLFLEDGLLSNYNYRICIDIANGHMQQLINLCKEIKLNYKNVVIMTGNIANPNTLLYYSGIIDYVRLGIGSGFGCITSSNTGIHYPMASLINECYKVKNENNLKIKLVADGGIRNYSDVIKALALGADYVMIGGLFARFIEICPSNIIEDELGKFRTFYGMASKMGQIALTGQVTKTAEGISKTIKVNEKLSDWIKNMEHYLRSAMSYCNSLTLSEFIGKPKIIINSYSTLNSVNK